MKMVYFLVALKKVPVPYYFRLYTYGPYDSDVLDDLSYAEVLGGVESELKIYPKGYGYEIGPGKKVEKLTDRASDFLQTHRPAIDWAVDKFAHRTAGDLELLSTIVFVKREVEAKKLTDYTDERIIARVHEIKPHFTREKVAQGYREAVDEGLVNN
jgi:uncharacterized protein YwgA